MNAEQQLNQPEVPVTFGGCRIYLPMTANRGAIDLSSAGTLPYGMQQQFAAFSDTSQDEQADAPYVFSSSKHEQAGPVSAPPHVDVVIHELIKTTDTSAWPHPSHDPAGIDYNEITQKLEVSDSEIEEILRPDGTPHENNFFTVELTGEQTGAFSTLGFSSEPTDVDVLSDGSRVFFDDDTGKVTHTTSDLLVIGQADYQPPHRDIEAGAVTKNGRLAIGTGVEHSVGIIDSGQCGFTAYPPKGDDVLRVIDTASVGARVVDGLTYDPQSDVLTALSAHRNEQFAVEIPVSGITGAVLVHDLSLGNGVSLADIASGPASDGSGGESFYTVDRGVDNNIDPNAKDGKLREHDKVPLAVANSVNNPGFENGPTGWQVQGNVNMEQDASGANTVATLTAEGNTLAVIISEPFPVQPGDRIVSRMQVLQKMPVQVDPAARARLAHRIVYTDANEKRVGSEDIVFEQPTEGAVDRWVLTGNATQPITDPLITGAHVEINVGYPVSPTLDPANIFTATVDNVYAGVVPSGQYAGHRSETQGYTDVSGSLEAMFMLGLITLSRIKQRLSRRK